MPLVVLPASTTQTVASIEVPAGWVLTEQARQSGRGSDAYYLGMFLSSVIESQLEMFPHYAAVDESYVFKSLVEQWRSQRSSTSSTTEMVLCPAYQSIIGMGPRAIRFILAELVSEGDDPDHWFWALQVLTGADPVSEEDEGNLRRMSRAWLSWAASEGYAW